MDWLKKMNVAIEYIENSLDGELDVSAAARLVGSSPFHFQKMFFAIVGLTPTDYARKRRLSKAAMEVTSGDRRIIDIALHYGYDSPNAFTRAFRAMHGVTPSEARRSEDYKLSVFNRVSFHIDVKGGTQMTYKIIEKPAFDLIGKSKHFRFDRFAREAPKYWKEFVATKDYETLYGLNQGQGGAITNAPILSAYFPTDGDNRSRFNDVLGLEKEDSMETDGFELFHIPAATYAEFTCRYASAMKMNKYIYGEWFASTGYERDGSKPDIAAYFPIAFKPMSEMVIRWWIPIIR